MTAPPHILVVDDDRQVVRYLKKALEENGYTVTGATSGKQALAARLAILDWMMPGMEALRCAAWRVPHSEAKSTF